MYVCVRGWMALHRLKCANTRQLILNKPWVVRQSPCVACVQRRNMSEETYRTYFSPESPPIGFAQEVLETFQSVTGLPWWASLILTTVTLRTCITLPLQIYSNHILARVENLQPEIMDLSKTLRMEVAHAMKKFSWEQPYARKKYNATMRGLVRDLYIRENCHPFKASIVMWVQLPMWISISFALRNMSGFYPFSGEDLQVLCAELSSGGLLWFTDLTVPDSTWILPVILGISNLCIIEMQSWKKGKETRFQKGLTNFLRGLSVVMIPIGASVPSCMCLYWVSSSLFGFAQNIAFKFPRVRRAVRIPITPSESDTPIRDMLEIARTKYKWKSKKEDP